MAAFFRVLSLELRALGRDRILLAALAGFLLCAGYALYCGHEWQSELRRSAQHIEQRDQVLFEERRDTLRRREEAGESGPRGFYDPSHPGAVGIFGGRNAVLPPSPWSLLSVGQTDLVPQATLVTTQADALQDAADSQSPLLLLLGRFDLVFVLTVLFPLLVLGFTHDLVSREREQGRLALMLSHSASSALVVGARGLARALPLFGAGVAATCAGYWLMDVRGDDWLRLVLWCVLVLAYGAVWFWLGVLVSVCSRRAATSALGVLGGWLLLVVVVPSGYDAVVGWMVPLPSQTEHLVAKRDRQREAEERADSLLHGYVRDHPELAVSETDDAMMAFMPRYLAVTEAVARDLRPLEEAFQRAKRAQQQLAQRLRFVSPTLVLQSSLCDIAGTGPRRHAQFDAATREFQSAWRSFFLPLAFEAQRLRSADYGEMPVFRMPPDPVRKVAASVVWGLVALIAAAAILAVLAVWRIRFLRPAED